MRLADVDRLITYERTRILSAGLLAAYLVGAAVWLLSFKNGLDALGKPFGYDFIAFHSAGRMALDGRAADAYDLLQISAVQRDIVPAASQAFPWLYPPVFLLVTAPLALIPYGAAMAAWAASTLALFLAMVRRLSNHPWAPVLALGFPAVFANAMNGQNGFLTAGLLGLGLLALERRPFVAGLLLGLLIVKPHFGLLLPVLFLAARRWPAFAGAAVSVIGLCAASLLAFGLEPWAAFVAGSGQMTEWIARGWFPAAKSPSVFLGLQTLGAPSAAALSLHAALAAALALLTFQAWRRPGEWRLKVALAVPAIVLVSPYAFVYDLVLLAIPIGLLADHARRSELPVGTRTALALAYLAPAIGPPIAEACGLQLMTPALLALYAAAWRTLAADRRAALAQPALPQPI